MIEYYQVWCSAETLEQAKDVLHALIKSKLIVGGTILNGPSSFWWKGEQVNMDYFYVMGFTISENRKAIEKQFSKLSKEEIPMVSFVKIEGNSVFLDYIYKYTNRQ